MRRTQWLASLLSLAVILVSSTASLWAQSPGSASEFYLEYRKAFDKAKAIEDLFPYMTSKTKAQVEATPKADRAQMFEVMKMLGAITDVKIVKEARGDDRTVLTVEALDPDKAKTTGTVTIVKEGGAWKLDSEKWSSS